MFTFVDHRRSGMVYNFGRACLFVCLSVCLCLSGDNFRKLWLRKFIFAHRVGLYHQKCDWVSSYMKVIGSGQGDRSKKNEENLYSGNVKLP